MRRNQRDDFDDVIDEEIDFNPKSKMGVKKKQQLDFFDLEDETAAKDTVKLPRISMAKDQQTILQQKYPSQYNLKPISRKRVTPSSKILNEQSKQKHIYTEPTKKQQLQIQEPESNYNQYEEDFENFENQHTEELSSKPQSIYSPKIPQKIPPKQVGQRINKQNLSVGRPSRIVKSTTKPVYNLKNKIINKSNSIKDLTPNNAFPIKKYANEVDRQFTDINLNIKSIEEVEKINQKVRTMIRKLNQQLNIILNKAALQQKSASNKKSVDQILRVLHSEKINNEKVIQRQTIERKKAKGKVGMIKDEDYEVDIDKEIEDAHKKKKELQKAIERLSLDVNYGQRKATNSLSKKGIEITKAQLVNLKKQKDKLHSQNDNMQSKLQEMSSKNESIEKKHTSIVKQALSKGVSLQTSKPEKLTQHRDLVERQNRLKKHLTDLENLNHTKQTISQNENQRIRRSLTALDSEINDIYSQIVDLGEKSSALIQKEKQNTKIIKNLIHTLEKINQSVGNAPTFDKNLRKTSSIHKTPSHSQNQTKQTPPQPSKGENLVNYNDSVKPNFKRKKSEQRIWKEESKVEQKEVAPDPVIMTEIKEPEKQTSNFKPKFKFKKSNNDASNQEEKSQKIAQRPPIQLKVDPPKQQNIQPQQQVKMAGPFKKFKRQSKQDNAAGYVFSTQEPNNTLSVKEAQFKIAQNKPADNVPRRFTLKTRGEQNSTVEGQGSSLIMKNDAQPQKQDAPLQTVQQKINKQPLPPRIRNFGNKNAQQSEIFVQNKQVLEKPIQNINNQILSHESSQVNSNTQQKDQQKLSSKKFVAPPKQQLQKHQKPVDSYAPPPRQGRIKKQKINLKPTKMSYNLNQAEDMTVGMVEQKLEVKAQTDTAKKYQGLSQKEKEPDLNQLLGVKNTRKDDDDDLVFQDKALEKAKPKPKVSQQNDFFGFQL